MTIRCGRCGGVVGSTTFALENLAAGRNYIGHLGEVIRRQQPKTPIASHLRVRSLPGEALGQALSLTGFKRRPYEGSGSPRRRPPTGPPASVAEAFPCSAAPQHGMTDDLCSLKHESHASPEMTANLHPVPNRLA
jgi:hypothetical protein